MNLEAAKKIDRRRFITYLVAAPTLTFVTRFAGSPREAEAAASADGNFVQMILEVTPDNRIIMQVERAEIGQGIATAFAMLVAEELDAKLDDIDVRLAAMGFVGGSNSIRSSWSPVRSTAATARAYLVTAAASIWNVDATTLTTPGDTTVFDPTYPGGRSLTYGQVTTTAATLQSTSIPSGVRSTPKAYVNHNVIGKPTTQLGIGDIVTGKTRFTLDVQLPNALPTVVARPPTINAPPTVDTSGIGMMDGVVAVTTIPTGVAISFVTRFSAPSAGVACAYGMPGRYFMISTFACWYSFTRLGKFGSFKARLRIPSIAALWKPNCGLKLRKNVRWPLGRLASPTTLMRAPSAEPVISVESTVLNPGVNGAPLMKDVIPLTCQLSSSQPTGFEPSLAPNFGRSYVSLKTSVCVRS